MHTDPSDPLAVLSDRELDQLLSHPYWEPLGPELDPLVACLPPTTASCERTTILTWIYQQQGVMGFLELCDRITGFDNVTLRKKHIRGYLRGLERLLLVSVVNFQGEDEHADEEVQADGVLGRHSLISLNWSGMVWLRRAWQARARLGTLDTIQAVHQTLVAEEDEGKANEPFWVENVTGVDPDAGGRRAPRHADHPVAITSVFALAQGMPRRRAR